MNPSEDMAGRDNRPLDIADVPNATRGPGVMIAACMAFPLEISVLRSGRSQR